MEDSTFANLADLVRRRSGIALTRDKVHAVSRRLIPVAHIFGFKNSETLLAELAHPHEELARAVTEAITTQDTSFFRDPAIFDHLETGILPALLRTRADRKRLRIWCAGCATGQEAYSLAILLDKMHLVSQGWNIDLIATDISADAIARAKDGVFSPYEIQRGLPASMRSQYFISDAGGRRATERLRRSIVLRAFNLLDHFGWLGELDVIFCRNVLIYFAPEERVAVLEKLAHTLASDGRLVLGAAEGSANNALPFKATAGPRGVFVKN